MKITEKRVITRIDLDKQESEFLIKLYETLSTMCHNYEDCALCPLNIYHCSSDCETIFDFLHCFGSEEGVN